MKSLLKNLGLLLMLAGVITLIVGAFTGNVDNNAILGGSAAAIVIGLVSYIIINKRIAD
ncbi:MAG: hypothetical protein LBF17_03755 [Mediterranea sp.]|jgi:hypothetical protein|nr:hypothetical protein [Mediterranea sp.]